ncbi:MAG: hypothetical protein MJ226_08455 [archaeon]|nr:hypothetical protein [archaeon]
MYVENNYNQFPSFNKSTYSNNIKPVKDSFMDTLNNLFKKINGFLENFNKKDSSDDFDEIINSIKESFISLDNILNINPLYEDEIYPHSSIIHMSIYILNDLDLLIMYIHFIQEMLISLKDIIESKRDLESNQFNERYEEFTSNLIKWEQFFYTQIYTPSEFCDDETISDITNSLVHIK